jgi:hypothetical protein
MLIALREDDGPTYTLFAEYAVRGSLRGDNRRYTTAFERGGRVATECVALAPVFGGETQLIADTAPMTSSGKQLLAGLGWARRGYGRDSPYRFSPVATSAVRSS